MTSFGVMSLLDKYNAFVREKPYLGWPQATHMSDKPVSYKGGQIVRLYFYIHLDGQPSKVSDRIHQNECCMPPGYNNILIYEPRFNQVTLKYCPTW